VRAAPRSGRAPLPADERVPPLNAEEGELELDDALEVLRRGELELEGRLVDASNATLLCTIRDRDHVARCVYKPVTGERPLWDFPDGTLAGREYAAYLLSEAFGGDIVPPTVLRDGPFGTGMVQWWVDIDESVDLGDLVRADVPDLRHMALFDAVANNADRKGGHLLPVEGGHIYGCDHGLTFHHEDKLRTVLWGWRGLSLTDDECELLSRIDAGLGTGGSLRAALEEHLTRREVTRTARRVQKLLQTGLFPQPSGDWPAIPWPPF
jgi:uncharacterized repeat protein (TIGR03843 family)